MICTTITIRAKVRTIGNNAFQNCYNLNSLNIPGSVTDIGSNAFGLCFSLSAVAVHWLSPLAVQSNIFSGVPTYNIPLIVPGGTEGIYSVADVWKDFYQYLPLSSNTNLHSLSVSDGILSPTFSASDTSYICTVPYSVKRIKIFATAVDSASAIVRGTGDNALEVGINKFEVVVEAPDGSSTKTYHITVIREEMPDPIVSFNTQGGNDIASQIVLDGGHVVRPADPRRDGYIFAGWYIDAGHTKLWDFTTDVVLRNITLYADWISLFTVSFNTQGDNEASIGEQLVLEGGYVARPTDPFLDGYIFDGWYTESSCINIWNFDTNVVTENTTLYAKWSAAVIYNVNFNTKGGGKISSQSIELGGMVLQPEDPVHQVHTFGGWYMEANCVNVWHFGSYVVTGEITLYAKWLNRKSTDIITVIFNTQGGSYVNYQYVESGDNIMQPNDPVRPGYRFAGWYSDAEYNNVWNFISDKATGDIILYAKWDAILNNIEEESAADMKIYPNPFTEKVHITGAEGYMLNIMNTSGVTVRTHIITNANETITFGNYPAGVYLFYLYKGKQSVILKAIKK